MTGKTHAICGLITMAAITVAHAHGFDFEGHQYLPAIGLISAAPGSYMPDIDLPTSKYGRKVKPLSKHLKHRGITHTLLFPALILFAMLTVASAGVPFLPDLIFGFMVGYDMHLVADMFNKKGIPLFWPLTNKHIHVASFLTSSWQEGVFIILWLGVNVGCLYFLSK